MKLKKIFKIILPTLLILLVPIAIFTILCLKEFAFEDKDFWLAYMSFSGSVILASVAFWQNEKLQEENIRLQEKQYQDGIVRENLTTEHPLLKIESVKLFSCIGRALIEEYQASEHQENYYIGNCLEGKLAISVKNIGNGFLQNMNHIGLEGFHAKENSKSIGIGESGQIFLFFRKISSKDMTINLQYKNIRGFEYHQKLNIIVNEVDNWDFDCDDNGLLVEGTERLEHIETQVYVVLSSQEAIGFTKTEEETIPWID